MSAGTRIIIGSFISAFLLQPLTALAGDMDTSAIIQRLIDAPSLNQYFHVDAFPERRPLVIVLKGASADGVGSITKFGAPVKIVTDESTAQPHLTLNLEKSGDNSVTVSFDYKPEGVQGQAILVEKDGAVTLDSISTIESSATGN